MPTQVVNDSNSSNNEIKVKTAYNGEVMITYINEKISYDELCTEIRGICRFSPDQVIYSFPHSTVFNVFWIYSSTIDDYCALLLGLYYEMG